MERIEHLVINSQVFLCPLRVFYLEEEPSSFTLKEWKEGRKERMKEVTM